MNQKPQTIDEIEAEYELLSEKLDHEKLDYDEFVKQVDRLPSFPVGNQQWRLNRAGEWVYQEGGVWQRGNIRQALAKEETLTGQHPPKAAALTAKPPASSKFLPTVLSRVSTSVLIGATVLLLLLGMGLFSLLWGISLRSKSTATSMPVVSADDTSTPDFTLTTPWPTFTPSPTALPPTFTSSPTSLPPTFTPSPVLPPDTPAWPTPTPMPTVTQSPPSPSPESQAKEIVPVTTTPPTPVLQGKIAYADYDPVNETYHIHLLDLSAMTSTKFIPEAANPCFSPNGQEIAYRSWAADNRGLWVQEVGGSKSWQPSEGYESARPQWSPDGKGLIFSSRQAGDRRWQLYYPIDQAIAIPDLGWAADWLNADTLIYAGSIKEQPGLYLANLDGFQARRFTNNQTDTAPAVSADGSYVAYTSKGDSGDNWDVYIVDHNGKPVRRLTTHPDRDGIPAWSPDDHYLAFASHRNGSWGLWVIDAAGQGEPKLLASLNGLDFYPRQATEVEKHDWTMHTITWSPLNR
ncbi:MAG: PD40 domain-containing protein [Anaerolineae bacterium]|nr:PD40 domain-containing protein [Anaerolineae bacterium]